VTHVIRVSRKKGESFDAMLRRFRTHMTRRGVVVEVREKRYTTQEKSRNVRRTKALKRLQKTDKMNYLKKTGQLPEVEVKHQRR